MTTAEARLDVATGAAMMALGERLGRVLRRGDLVLLSGELGAGKTTLTRGIGAGMGVRGPITSPTFVLSRVHPSLGGTGVPLIHVDAYRLGSAAELLDLDLDFEAAAVVVEWGDGLLDDVVESWLRVRIDRARGGESGDGRGSAPDLPAAGEIPRARASEAGAGSAPEHDPDDVEDDDAPRTVRLTGHGPAWAGLRGVA